MPQSGRYIFLSGHYRLLLMPPLVPPCARPMMQKAASSSINSGPFSMKRSRGPPIFMLYTLLTTHRLSALLFIYSALYTQTTSLVQHIFAIKANLIIFLCSYIVYRIVIYSFNVYRILKSVLVMYILSTLMDFLLLIHNLYL